MSRILSVILATVMVAVLGACGAKSAQTPAPASQAASASEAPAAKSAQIELMVSAAASLTDCMNELKTVYEADIANVKITFNFGASGALQQQIEQGAPADIFFSAGKKQMQTLVDGGLMDNATVQDVLENKVVLVTPKDGATIASFPDLAGNAVEKVGVGEPQSVPVGQYTAEIFESLGLTAALAPKLVLAKDVREVLIWVETGNVQAGIVYATDAQISDKVTVSCTAPEGSHNPVIYPIGVTKDSKVSEEAKRFLDFLTKSDLSGAIFSKYGFATVRVEPKD